MRALFRRLIRCVGPPVPPPPPFKKSNGELAAQALLDAERKLNQARRDWPDVREAHDDLASWFSQALGQKDR
jgi:hypothetical protein